MTNGAFYAHFESKEDLIANAVSDQLAGQRAVINAQVRDRAGLEQFVRSYLSPAHRDSPEDGCPSAALLDEIGRCADRTKRAYTTGMLAIVDDIAVLLAPHDPASVRVKVISVFAMMAGALQLSRALSDRHIADEVLERGIRDVLAILNTRQ